MLLLMAASMAILTILKKIMLMIARLIILTIPRVNMIMIPRIIIYMDIFDYDKRRLVSQTVWFYGINTTF